MRAPRACARWMRRGQPAGDEPATARSPLRLRVLLAASAALLATVVLLVCAAALIGSDGSRDELVVGSIVAGAVLVTASVDLLVLRCRLWGEARQRGTASDPSAPRGHR